MLPVADALQSDSEEEEDDNEEEEEFDSEGEDGEMSSQSSARRYPSRSKNSRSTRLTRNNAGTDPKRSGKVSSALRTVIYTEPPASMLNIHGSFSEGRAELNGHGTRSSRRERRCQNDSDRSASRRSDGEDAAAVRRSFKRKTARAAVNKIKLLEASDEDYEEEEERPRRSSSRLRHTVRTSKRTAVIQSSSDSEEEPSTQGRNADYH